MGYQQMAADIDEHMRRIHDAQIAQAASRKEHVPPIPEGLNPSDEQHSTESPEDYFKRTAQQEG